MNEGERRLLVRIVDVASAHPSIYGVAGYKELSKTVCSVERQQITLHLDGKINVDRSSGPHGSRSSGDPQRGRPVDVRVARVHYRRHDRL